MERNSTDVIIEDKVYKISTDQDASYVRELAEYINEKMELLHRQSAYSLSLIHISEPTRH